MRISTITNLTALILITLALAFAAFLWWGFTQLNRPYSQYQSYYLLKEQVSIEGRRKINDYLQSGDALKLSAAEEHFSRLLETSKSTFHGETADSVALYIDSLLEGLKGKFRAAGKLSGDTQGLLLHAEREMRANIEGLAEYGAQGRSKSATTSGRYLQYSNQMLGQLLGLAEARQRYFDTGQVAYAETVTRVITELQASLEQMKKLPKLGIYVEEEVDDLAAMLHGAEQTISAREEKGQAQMEELGSLLKRYPQEWQRTLDQYQMGIASRNQISELVDSLEKEVLNAEASIKEQRDTIVGNVITLSVLFILLFIAAAVFIRLFQGRVVLKNLARLRHSLQLLADSGEVNLLDIRNPHSEVGQLATLVNTLLESQEKQKQGREHLLHNVSESLHAMIEQIDNIHQTTLQTRDNVQRSQQLMYELDHLAEQVRHTSNEVETYSRQTENSMGIIPGEGVTQLPVPCRGGSPGQ